MKDFIDDYSVGGDPLHENHVVVFANQKGGVGKSTICAHFANYLSDCRHVPVLVVDADLQHNLLEQRKDDLKQNDEKPPYIVRGLSLSNPESVRTFMEFCKGLPGTTIVDAPGNLSQQGLVEVFMAADFIMIPFLFDLNSIRSTRTFVLTILKLRKAHPEMNPQLVFFPNLKRPGVGNSEETEAWKNISKFFSQFGKMAMGIGQHQDIRRYNTMSSNKKARKFLKNSFDSFFHIIYNLDDDD